MFTEDELYIFIMLIFLIFIFEVQLSLIAGNVKHSYFTLKNSFCNIHLFMEDSSSEKSSKCHYFVIFTKVKYVEFSFSVCFDSSVIIIYILENAFFCFTLVLINMPSQKRKKRTNRQCYKKQVKIICQLKLFLREIN